MTGPGPVGFGKTLIALAIGRIILLLNAWMIGTVINVAAIAFSQRPGQLDCNGPGIGSATDQGLNGIGEPLFLVLEEALGNHFSRGHDISDRIAQVLEKVSALRYTLSAEAAPEAEKPPLNRLSVERSSLCKRSK